MAKKIDDTKSRTAAATVWLPQAKGQGVLVPGGFILTAAHCVGWTSTGDMAFGDLPPTVQVRTAKGKTFMVNVAAVEPVADIAVLASADTQAFTDEADAFAAFCETTLPVPVSGESLPSAGVPILVRTHRGTWTKASAHQVGDHPGPGAYCKPEREIEAGTSGGPMIDNAGRLVGVVSTAGAGIGTMPRPHLALPGWVWRCIEAAQGRRKGGK